MGAVIFNGYKPQCSICMRTIDWHIRPPDTYICECGTLYTLEDVKNVIVWEDSVCFCKNCSPVLKTQVDDDEWKHSERFGYEKDITNEE